MAIKGLRQHRTKRQRRNSPRFGCKQDLDLHVDVKTKSGSFIGRRASCPFYPAKARQQPNPAKTKPTDKFLNRKMMWWWKEGSTSRTKEENKLSGKSSKEAYMIGWGAICKGERTKQQHFHKLCRASKEVLSVPESFIGGFTRDV